MRHNLIGLLIALVPIACASAPGEPSADESESGLSDVGFTTKHHLAGTPMSQDRAKSSSGVFYSGGPVLSDAELHLVAWGSRVSNVADVEAFYRLIAGSPYLAWLKEYSTPSQDIGPGRFAATHVIAPSSTGTRITDRAIQRELARQINGGKLPPPGPNVLYLVHLPAGVSVSSPDLGDSCTDYCAYHGSFTKAGASVFYTVSPDLSACPRCMAYYKSRALSSFEALTAFASHEVLEAITDPDVDNDNAWSGLDGEIGDLCEGHATDLVELTPFTAEKGWSNAHRACVAQ